MTPEQRIKIDDRDWLGMLTLGGNICYTFKLARIVAGVGTSHVPAIGAASDQGKDQNDYFKPMFNDHASAFSVEVINTFVLGVADGYAPADEGYSPRQVPYVHGHADFASHIFDNMFLDNLQDNAEKLTKISHTDYIRDAGSEGIELIMWLVRRGAMEKPREIYRHYHVPVSYSAAGVFFPLVE
ncbi:hypothetical protein EBB79_22515 (plasmid) [Parasedimentitalea marina]|uniref:Uncharacterized protein n=1 Tax=Parasedimentitalea marina TaxID=2483033 RepID=A0A3T0N9L7_9RHOB|nr:hypothetical protein [Parasedimentitalea marina]AZV80730.1 hypothetical protein EBB79_22515 [Parasedimentitalea marina]